MTTDKSNYSEKDNENEQLWDTTMTTIITESNSENVNNNNNNDNNDQ